MFRRERNGNISVGAVVLLRSFVGCILRLSGIGKLLDRTGTERAVRGYGVPRVWAQPTAVGPVIAEISTGSCLVTGLIPGVAPWLALLLLSCFLGGTVRAISQGAAMDCHCFGAITKEQIGP